MLQVLPGISVVPHQCDDAEPHRRRAKDDATVERRFHTQKVTDIPGSGGDQPDPDTYSQCERQADWSDAPFFDSAPSNGALSE